jgi:hypothetical protein
MADILTEPIEEASTHSQLPQNIITDIVTAVSMQNHLKSSTDVIDEEGGQMHEIIDGEIDLPPYESVSAERFIMKLDDGWMQWLECQRSCAPIMQCRTGATFDDFILISSQSGCPSEQASSIVSCSTDDLSHTTNSTETLGTESSNESTLQTLKNSMLQGWCQENHRSATRSNSDITDWLCNLNCTQSEAILASPKMPSAPTDEHETMSPVNNGKSSISAAR